jgi:hypothetical protein
MVILKVTSHLGGLKENSNPPYTIICQRIMAASHYYTYYIFGCIHEFNNQKLQCRKEDIWEKLAGKRIKKRKKRKRRWGMAAVGERKKGEGGNWVW